MNELPLDIFGAFLMTRVRDEAIKDWDFIIDGKMKDARGQRIYQQVKELRPEDRELLRSVVAQVVDTTLHHLLWSLEDAKEVKVAVHTPEAYVPDIASRSDGLAGELYTEDGWIERFSRQRRASVL